MSGIVMTALFKMFVQKNGSDGVSEMIDVVSLDGVDYAVITEKEQDGDRLTMRLKVLIGGKEKSIRAEYNTKMIEDFESSHKLDGEAELKDIMLGEIKMEIFQHLYAAKMKDQIGKLSELVGKDDSALDELIANDAVFAAYIRNFHPDQYEEVKRA